MAVKGCKLKEFIQDQQIEKKIYRNSECEKCNCFQCELQLVKFSNGIYIICDKCLAEKRNKK